MLSKFQAALQAGGADFIDIRVEETRRTEILVNGGQLEKAQEIVEFGGAVRALYRGGWGFVSFNDPTNLSDLVQQAIRQAQAVGRSESRLAPITPVTAERYYSGPGEDPRRIPLKEKVELALQYGRAVKAADGRIVSAPCSYRDGHSIVTYASSEGAGIVQETVELRGGVSAIAREGEVMQSVYKSFGNPGDYSAFRTLEAKVPQAVEEALELLGAPPAEGGKQTVICGPSLAGVFIHEAFGHLSEADNVAENEALLKQMTIGSRFGQEHLNVLDGGAAAGHRGSYAFDDEGVPSQLTYLIKDGLLAGRLHNRETAGMMGEAPTGNARTVSYRYPPICRMSNTYIAPGDASFEEMIAGVKDGLYAVGGGSGTTSGEMFTFAAEKAYRIKRGKKGQLVRDLVLTGNVFETLLNIDMVGSDIVWGEGGGCGRSYGLKLQYPLAVTMSSPHIRIQHVLVGGR